MIQSQLHIPATVESNDLLRFILKMLAYLTYSILVLVDGLNNPESFDTRLLTIPYFISGLALVRAFCEALDAHYDYHAGVFAIGLSTLSALA